MHEPVVTRRTLLERAGVAVAAAGVAGSAIGPAKAGLTRIHKAPPRGGKITWAFEQLPAHIAPFGAQLGINLWIRQAMYESLLDWDSKLSQIPSLAPKWTLVDKRTVDFDIRPNVKFHNGKELTSADVVYSLRLQGNPPAPGTQVALLGSYPPFELIEARGKYKVRVVLKQPDARLFGYFAQNAHSSIVPEGMYDSINPAVTGIGTGPFRLVNFQPSQGAEYVAHGDYWQKGRPYPSAISFKIMLDEVARAAALRARAIDGASFSSETARSLAANSDLQVLKGKTAGFREMRLSMKGPTKPWFDKRVRQAINHAINRTEITQKVYSGDAFYAGFVPEGYGKFSLTQSELKSKWLKFDLPKARALMREAGVPNGFEVTLTVIAAPPDIQNIAAVIQANLAKINIKVKIVPQEFALFAANDRTGNFEWHLTYRGPRADIDGFVAEFHPASAVFNLWYPNYKNIRAWRLIGNGRITLDQAKRLPMYQEVQRLLLDDVPQIPIVAPVKYHVVRKRVRNMFVSYSEAVPGLHRTAWVQQ